MKNKLLYLIAIVLLFSPKINYGQAPTLGTAAGFILFTSVGAITNTGISQVTGNVGSNVGASTNFGNVNGIMQSQNLATAACSTSVLLAYNQLAGTTATFFPSASLGGDTLLPGVYSVSGASTLTNVLTLNAKGNPNAIFIFKLQGAFSAAANAKVKLINGALACNVFWKIEGLTNMASNVTMRGTIITNNAAINMSAGDTLEGRAFTTAGAISVNGVMAYTPIGCGSPILTGPLAPPLGTTANYALFSSIGPVTNTGITNIIGDVGTNSGLTTGFNPLLVNGTIHPIPDISTIQCSSDLNVVYTYLNALPADIELLFPAQFGNKLVLTPHTYLLNAATALTDTLFLNGQGNPNAVFVIKIFGALSTSTYSNVVLTNGTKSRNVYWLVNGAVSINDYSVFRGTIIANNGAINFAIGSLLDGRALTTVGAVNVNAMTANAPNAPFVVTPPIAKLVCLGDTARFIVSASGTNLTFQWRKGNINLINGLNVSGVTNDTLTIFPVTYADTASNYNVVIMGNVNPNDTTIGVSLKINSPTITAEPLNKTACLGSNVTFSITTSGTGITYQWRKGAINLINGGNIQGVTSDTLKINGVSISDTASNYNVIITGVCAPKDTSINVSLYLNNTVITTNPSNQTICLGSSTRFITRATGSGLTYQWRRGNINLVNGLNISGATTDTLRFNTTTVLDTATNYNVIISSTCSLRDTSANVSLNINLPLVISINPSNQTICLGSSTRFITRATGSGLTYQWRRGNINLVNGLNISGATTDTLRFNATTILDTATNYNVIISSTCSLRDTSTNVALNINLPLVKSINPSNQTVCLGSSARFITRATGSGLTYQWRRGNINLVNGLNISGATTDTLRFNTTTVLDTATNYNVIISSNCSLRDTSANVSLNISTPPVIITEPINQTACEASSASFTAVVSGNSFTYQWRKGNVNLVNGGNISGANSATLIINPVSLSDVASNYNLVVTNACNFIDSSSNASLIVVGLPTASASSNSPICIGNAINLSAQTVSGGIYTWNGPNGFSSIVQNPSITNALIADSGNYTLMVTKNGCNSTLVNLNVIVRTCVDIAFSIPEGFSPNGDGINDLFVINGIINYPALSINVYNRWGSLVFDASPYLNNWNGKSNSGLTIGGDDLPIGTYFYIINLGDGSPIRKGTIYLNK
jgi:gliding motility-associated-like protein